MTILHAGLHKTGSTFLQRHVFPYLDVNYYGDGNLSMAQVTPGLVPLISNEAALGWPYHGNRPDIARLLLICKDVGITHIVLVRRHFPHWVRSLYFQTLNEGGTAALGQWYARNHECLEEWRCLFPRLLDGADRHGIRCLVTDHHTLQTDPMAWVAEMCDFAELERPDELAPATENVSRYGTATIAGYRLINKGTRLVGIRARRIIQRGWVGKWLQTISRGTIALPDDLVGIDWA